VGRSWHRPLRARLHPDWTTRRQGDYFQSWEEALDDPESIWSALALSSKSLSDFGKLVFLHTGKQTPVPELQASEVASAHWVPLSHRASTLSVTFSFLRLRFRHSTTARRQMGNGLSGSWRSSLSSKWPHSKPAQSSGRPNAFQVSFPSRKHSQAYNQQMYPTTERSCRCLRRGLAERSSFVARLATVGLDTRLVHVRGGFS
jgi:hypothetical protein